jgi:hypothetical protein
MGISAILTFYTALLHLTRRRSGNQYAFRILRDLVVGTQSLQLWVIAKGWQFDRPYLLFSFVTLLFISGWLNNVSLPRRTFPRRP